MGNLFIVCWLIASGGQACTTPLPALGWANEIAHLHASKEAFGNDEGPRIYRLEQVMPAVSNRPSWWIPGLPAPSDDSGILKEKP